MKKVIIILMLLLGSTAPLFSQTVNGEILSDTNNVTVVRLWGTSEERGFAYGYLVGDRMIEVLEGFSIPYWGDDWIAVKQLIAGGVSFSIDPVYWHEAQAMMDGATAAGYNTSGYDSVDVMAANCLNDIYAWQINKSKFGFHCSTLMNWNDATVGTDLNGCSVISRHMDTYSFPVIETNFVIVIHIPSELDLQPWLVIGNAGEMAPASGLNSSGLSMFANGMGTGGSSSWNYDTLAGYEPYAFTFRKALESADYNQDGVNNMTDIRDAISSNPLGYASGINISALAPSTAVYDSLIALVAEVAPEIPYITFRTNSYNDTLPGDNLYAANAQIKRNNSRNYCWRYYGIVNNIGDGTGIGSQENWDLMKNYSNLGSNKQFMQYIPEWGQLNLSVYKNDSAAYLHEPITYDVNEFFNLPVPIANFTADSTVIVEGDTVHFTDLSENYPSGWEWEFNGGTPETSTEQNPVILYDTPGDYDVKLIVFNTYGSDTILKPDYIHVESSTNINSYNFKDIILYPVPAKDKLLIYCNDNIQSVEIINISGQVVKKLGSNTKQIEINIADLPDGLYIIQFMIGDRAIMKKIIKLK
jgi:PKD repeat protein